MAAVRDTFVNPLLTDISVGYTNRNFIAEQVFPTVTVEKEEGTYFVGDKEAWRNPADANRSEYARANRVANLLSTATYVLTERSLESPISERVMRNYSDPFNPKKNATNLVSQKLLLENEKDLVATILAGAGNTLNAASGWSTPATNVIGQIRTGRDTILKATGEDANLLILGKQAFDAVLENTNVVDRIKYTARASEATIMEALADFFGVERVLIGKAIENTAKEGQADAAGSYIWGNNAVLAYVPSSAALETPAAGYRLALREGRYVDEWYEQEIKTTFVRANDFYDNKIVVPTALYTITNCA